MLTFFAPIILVAGLWASGQRMVVVFASACLFGASAAASLPGLGGAPLTPAVFALPFLFLQAWRSCGAKTIARQALSGPGLWLALFLAWSVTSAFLFPRLFAGDTLVNTTDRNSMSLGVSLIALRPNSTHITQSSYALGGTAAFILVSALIQGDAGHRSFRRAIMALGCLNVLAALINLLELYAGLPSVLQYVRNAQYAIIDGDEVGGLMRITGTFSEASAFAAFTLPIFAFTFSLWREGKAGRAGGLIALASGLLLMFSTSSTAYAALALYLVLIVAGSILSIIVRGELPLLRTGSVLIAGLVLAACLAVLLRPALVDTVEAFVRLTLVKKLDSSSGIERSSWNAQAWRNFLDTYGLGVGLGGARASSYLMVLLSNVGLAGTVLFLGFVAGSFRRGFTSAGEAGSDIARAAAHAMLATLIAAAVSGTVFDLGMSFYVFAAAAASAALGTANPSTRRDDVTGLYRVPTPLLHR